jgi:hypothetical protein
MVSGVGRNQNFKAGNSWTRHRCARVDEAAGTLVSLQEADLRHDVAAPLDGNSSSKCANFCLAPHVIDQTS